MNFDNISIGVDIEEVKRFENKSLDGDANFLNRIFTQQELDYCFSKKVFAQSLCARYCAKEAVVKALSGYGISDVFYKDIEVLSSESGLPVCNILKYPNIEVKLSLSHTKEYAVVNVILNKNGK